MIHRRLLACAAIATLTLGLTTAHAQSAGFPTKPIRMIASSLPGTLVDQSARLYADRMSTYLRQPVVVENVAGAGTLVAVRQVLKAPADGYTLIVGANTMMTQTLINPKAGYDINDFTPIGEMSRSAVVLVVSATSPYKTLADLVAAAKKNPGQLTYGSSGTGSTNHLVVELLARSAGVKFTHIPYKGIAAAVPDVNAGRVNFLMGTPSSFHELLKSGALRALAISSEKRSPTFPDIPSLPELGYPEATFDVWIGALAPAGLPEQVKARLADALEDARKQSDLVKRFEDLGQEVSAVGTPRQFDTMMRADLDKLRKVVKEANITTE